MSGAMVQPVATPVEQGGGMRLLLAVAAAVVFWLLPLDLPPLIHATLAVTVFMVVAWINHAIDPAITGLTGCFLFWALRLAPFSTAFSGFADSTAWFLLGAVLFGTMATTSGLARRLAYLVMARIGHTYSRLLLGLILTDFLLTFVVPSGIARVVIMAAVALGLLDAFGVGRRSNIAKGMFIILTYTATIFDKMVIAGAASIISRGIIERVGGVEVLWSRWFVAYLPCDVITIVVAWRLTLYFYPPEKPALDGGAAVLEGAVRRMGRLSGTERRSALLMGAAIALWMTDFAHHISAPMIGLGIGLVATLPLVGVLQTEDVKRVNYLPIFFVASAVSMGQVLLTTKALDVLTGLLFSWMAPLITNVYSSTVVLYWSAFLYHVPLGDETSMLATSMPVLMNFAHARQLDPLALGMIWTFGAGAKVFVYQSAPMVVGYSYGCFDARDMLKIGACLAVVESVILVVLVPFYWPLIGI